MSAASSSSMREPQAHALPRNLGAAAAKTGAVFTGASITGVLRSFAGGLRADPLPRGTLLGTRPSSSSFSGGRPRLAPSLRAPMPTPARLTRPDMPAALAHARPTRRLRVAPPVLAPASLLRATDEAPPAVLSVAAVTEVAFAPVPTPAAVPGVAPTAWHRLTRWLVAGFVAATAAGTVAAVIVTL